MATTESIAAQQASYDLLAATNAALAAAVDLAQPRRTAAHALTVQAALGVAVEHPGRAAWATGHLRQLVQEWRAER